MDLVEQIEAYIHEANLLSHTIEKSNFMIEAIGHEEELRDHYIQQLQPTIDEYKETIKALDCLFQQYFVWEKKNQKTRNLRYRRLYKMIVEDLKKLTLPTSTR